MSSGIYLLSWGPGKEYIGQSVNIRARINNHLSKLRRNTHPSLSMQQCFWDNGEPVVSILDQVAEYNLNSAEVYYIKIYDSYNNGLNRTAGGGARHGGTLDTSWRPVNYVANTNKNPDSWWVKLIFSKWGLGLLIATILIATGVYK